MRTVICLLIALGIFQSSLALQCYECKGEDCEKSPNSVITCSAPTEAPSSPAPTDTTAQPTNKPSSSGSTPPSSANTPVSSADTPNSSANSPAPSSDTPAPSGNTPAPSGDTPAPSGNTPAPSGDTPKPSSERPDPSGNTVVSSANTPDPSGDREAPSAILSRKRRSMTFARESNVFKCYTQKTDDKVTERGCKLQAEECDPNKGCKECSVEKCNGSSSLTVSALTLGLVIFASKMF